MAGALDKYVYLTLHRTFQCRDLIVKYSKLERVATAVDQLEHPIIREAFKPCSACDRSARSN